MERKYKTIKESDLLESIKDSGGIISNVRKNMGKKIGYLYDWHTIKSAIESYESCKKALEDELNSICDMAETSILKSIHEGNTQDAKWFLSKKAKNRGYGDDVIQNITVNNTQSDNTEDIKKKLSNLSAEEKELYFELCEKMNDSNSE